jgi:peptidoglycan/LPS O-acetylase OafA/YrhL
MLVIGHHMHSEHQLVAWANPYGAMTIFFLVSGFIITTLALREERARGALSLKAFYVRRALRILPPYYCVLGVYCLLIFGLGVGAEKADKMQKLLAPYLLYYQELPFFLADRFGVGDWHNVPFYQSWSLGIEEKFYLAWPVLAFSLLRGRGLARGLLALAIGIGCACMPALLGQPGECLFPYWNILAGCALAVALDDERGYRVLAPLARPGVAGIVLVATLAVHLLGAWLEQVRYVHPAAVAVGMVVLLLGDGPVQRVLRTRAAVFLGSISYGIYLVHLLCINAVDRVLPPEGQGLAVALVAFALAILLTVLVASGLHAVVERPCLELARRWSRRIAGRSPVTPA